MFAVASGHGKMGLARLILREEAGGCGHGRGERCSFEGEAMPCSHSRPGVPTHLSAPSRGLAVRSNCHAMLPMRRPE